MDDRLEFDDIAAFITLSLFSIVSTPSKRDQKRKRTTISRTKKGENEKKEYNVAQFTYSSIIHSTFVVGFFFLSLSLLEKKRRRKRDICLLSCMYTYKKKTATNVIHGKIN
jgi:hypothetical protein